MDIYNFYIYIFLIISHYESENKSQSKKLEFASFKRKIKKTFWTKNRRRLMKEIMNRAQEK